MRPDGAARLLASTAARITSLVALPDDTRYGPWAGRLLAAAPEAGAVLAIDARGDVLRTPLSVAPEALAVVAPDEHFYGIDAAAGTLVSAGAWQFSALAGEVLVAQGGPGVLARVRWDGQGFALETLAEGSAWSDIGFAPSGIAPLGAVPSEALVVRHAPDVSGTIEGSVRLLSPESISLTGTAVVRGDLLVPGRPSVQVNGQATSLGTVDSTGSGSPTTHRVRLTGNASLGRVVRRVDAVAMPAATAPTSPGRDRRPRRDAAWADGDELDGGARPDTRRQRRGGRGAAGRISHLHGESATTAPGVPSRKPVPA